MNHGKEESLLFLISLLIQKYSRPFSSCIPEYRDAIEKACAFMEQHFAERMDLGQICRYAGLSKSTLLRTGFSDQSHFTHYFNRFIGLSPGAYRDIFVRKEEASIYRISRI